MDILSKRAKELRLQSKFTQRVVSIKVDITERNYQRLEAGISIPKIPTLIAIADLYGVSIDYLLGRTDRPEVLK